MPPKGFTADILEETLNSFLDKFAETFCKMITQFGDVLKDTINVQLATMNARLDRIENRMAHCDLGVVRGSSPPCDGTAVIEATTKAIIEAEKLKEEIKLRASNVVISGLPAVRGLTDKEMIEKFCEDNLTTKPRILRTRRLGANWAAPGTKVCATLECQDSVTALLQSSALLRQSTDPLVKKVYFNKDLTKAELKAAYEARCKKRATPSQNNLVGGASTVIDQTFGPTNLLTSQPSTSDLSQPFSLSTLEQA